MPQPPIAHLRPFRDAATDPKTPTPTPTLPPTQRDSVPPAQRERDGHQFSRAAATTTTPRRPGSPAFPQAQQSKKRKLGRPAGPVLSSRLPHLPLPPPLPNPAAVPVVDPLAATVATYISTTTRRAADITIALKRRTQSYEMISTHERWAGFSRGPESARLDLLKAMDDAVQADREILRVIAAELRDTLDARERLGGIVDAELTGEGAVKIDATARRRVVGRRKGWSWGASTLLVCVLVAVACAVKWYSERGAF